MRHGSLAALLCASLLLACSSGNDRRPILLPPIVNAGDRPLQPDDRLLVLVSRQVGDSVELGECISRGVQSRLPGGRPAPVSLPADARPQLKGLLSAAGYGDLAGGAVAAEDWDWIIFVEEQTAETRERIADGGGSPVFGGFAIGTRSEFDATLAGRVFDMRTGRLIGHSSAFSHATRDRGTGLMFVLGVPLIVPIYRASGEAGSATLCEPFGRLMGDTLVRAAAGVRLPQ